ncbi:acetyltransferase [Thraustotheca clavata]|uniref:Acetyltransferase n=1 Tax=Thraustotheca clavata TaxID=74557 RepID=A0A1V9Z6J3_9STRA|nr:acetyltransferase [Thraustotheca clavata]
MSSAVIVHRAVLADVPRLAPLFDAYRVFYKQESDLARAEHFLRERLTFNETVLYFATATNDEHPLGFVHLFPSFSSVSTEHLWILNDLFVSSSARRSGIATLLMNRAKQHSIETKAKGLMLETAHDNIAGQTLYESLGYEKSNAFHYFLPTPKQD